MNQKTVGCITGVLTIVLMIPIRVVLWIWLLRQTNAPTYVWVLFWVEVPVSVAIAFAGQVMKELAEK